VFADIITIGDEILIGQVVDTNSAFIASELNAIGITVRKIHSIADQKNALVTTLDEAIENSVLVVITGGLGPTSDDITKNTLQEYFGGEMILDTIAFQYICKIFEQRGIALSDRNRSQAMVPDSCQTLRNRSGSAPGMLFRKNAAIIASLPGVPFEMEDITRNELIPLLIRELNLPVRLHRTILTCGLPESLAADMLTEWEYNIPKNVKLAYLPSPGILRLRVSVSGDDRKKLNKQLIELVNEVSVILGPEYLFGYDEDSLQSVVGNLLKQKRSSLAIAESCTGGNIAHLITLVPGSSTYFKGSVTAYSNLIKQEILHISSDTIHKNGAVSQAVVEQMASGIQRIMKADFAVATSGIAGPDGGTAEKPVGTTWIAVATPEKVISQKFMFGDKRERNIVRASYTALNLLRNILAEY
jgi:nicotinamide-nucleotide amidase